jgi:8-oxo-dGTP pyrophosphatase MutT (NUDIX family)|uniref:Nudix hydrolase domain-containing protein n=1 Tax=viral metagenome TaxID=1070528 RepID=A0A6C0BZ18_9ZZZZ
MISISNSTYNFCNNCGKAGHTFSQCRKPIISIGVIATHYDQSNKKYKYLLICRKDSLGYIDFLRGKYPLYNKIYIQRLIDEMTILEKKNILIKSFDELWHELWGDFVGLQYRGEEHSAKEKFIQIKRGIKNEKSEYTLESIVKNSKTNWEKPEWGFPKGRRNQNESDKSAALREFEEETGYSKDKLDGIKNIMPFEEIFTGSNLKSYKHIYYLMYMKGERINADFQKSEVSEVKWCSLEESMGQIRPYNLEKKEIINNIDKILNKYSLIS